jgi:hypothetical protein
VLRPGAKEAQGHGGMLAREELMNGGSMRRLAGGKQLGQLTLVGAGEATKRGEKLWPSGLL